jgi:hypothetical protein
VSIAWYAPRVTAGPGAPETSRQERFFAERGLALACAVAVGLRLPTFRYPLVSDDEAIYDAMAQVVVRGGTMYRDTVDHKPPGLTYTYSAVRAAVEHLGGSFGAAMVGVHALGIAVVVLTCVTLHAIAREILEPRIVAFPPLLYAIASAASVPPDSLAVNGELLMNLPTAVAVLCALRAARHRGTVRLALNVAAGSFVGVATLYKYQAALVGLSLLFLLPAPRKSWRSFGAALVLDGAALATGLALPFAACAFYFHERGALADALTWGIDFNRHYLAEGPDLAAAATRLARQLLGVVLPSALVYGAAGFGLWRIVRDREAPSSTSGFTSGRALVVVWALESTFSVTLGRRFFGHYFLQTSLVFALLAAGPVAQLWQRRPRLAVAALALPAAIFFGIAALPEWTAKIVYASDPDFWTIGRAVAAQTKPDETIWVWGNVPQIYFTAARAPGVRFTFCNYLTGLSPGSRSEDDPTFDSRKNAVPGAWGLVVHDLDANRPALIVDTAAGGMKSYGKFPIASFPVLADYLRLHYRAAGVSEGAILYRRVD